MEKIAEMLINDIEEAVQEKLAELSFGKPRKKRKKKNQFKELAISGANAAGTAVAASILSDLKSKPVEAIKTRLYDMIDSAAKRFFH